MIRILTPTFSVMNIMWCWKKGEKKYQRLHRMREQHQLFSSEI